jgi:hypothetical protein
MLSSFFCETADDPVSCTLLLLLLPLYCCVEVLGNTEWPRSREKGDLVTFTLVAKLAAFCRIVDALCIPDDELAADGTEEALG